MLADTFGTVYDGEFDKGKRSGLGIEENHVTGEVYRGEWRDDRRHGRGTCTYADGSVFVGHWFRNTRDHGKITFGSGMECEPTVLAH